MPAMTTTAAAVPALSGYQKWVIALLAFLQFTIILDFMVISPLGALLMPALKITPAQFGVAVSSYAFSAGAAGLLTAGFAIAQNPTQSPAARPRPKPARIEAYARQTG